MAQQQTESGLGDLGINSGDSAPPNNDAKSSVMLNGNTDSLKSSSSSQYRGGHPTMSDHQPPPGSGPVGHPMHHQHPQNMQNHPHAMASHPPQQQQQQHHPGGPHPGHHQLHQSGHPKGKHSAHDLPNNGNMPGSAPNDSDNHSSPHGYGDGGPSAPPGGPPHSQNHPHSESKDEHQPGAYHPQQHSQYGRYHDTNVADMYGRYHMSGGKPTSMVPPSRPPQRYMPAGQPVNQSNQQPQQPPNAQQQQGSSAAGGPPQQPPPGQTPTLNSLLQSHPPAQGGQQPPPPPHHRYPNNYDQQQQPGNVGSLGPPPPQSAPGQQQGPPHQPPYGGHPPPPQQNWAPPPRPYSPQMGQPYRPPPPSSSSRGQSPYPGAVSGVPPNMGPYPSSQSQPPPSQPGGPQQQQMPPGSGNTQYSPYPQRYPTPPGGLPSGPNHRSPYPQPPHQYLDPSSRSWPPSGPSPTASPGPSGHPPPSPQHAGPPPSPNHAPSPSPQPPQLAPSPHQDSVGQNSNDSSSGVGTGVGTAPGTPNSLAMRPTPSPTGSSGSRSMSPAVGQQSLPMPPRPSSNHSQTTANNNQSAVPQPPSSIHLNSNNSNLNLLQNSGGNNHSNSGQQHDQNNTPPSRPPTAPGSVPSPSSAVGMAAQGSYQSAPPQPPHMHGYKMGSSPGPIGPGAGPQNMPPYSPQSQQQQQQQQYSQGNYSPRPQYPSNYGPGPTGQPPSSNALPHGGPGQYPNRPMTNHGSPHPQFPPYQQQNWGPPQGSGPQGIAGAPGGPLNHPGAGGKNASPATPPGGSPRPLNHLKQHLLHKGYGGSPSPTPPLGYGNGPGMHPPMGPPHHQMGPPHGVGGGGPPNSMGPIGMGPGNMGPPSLAPHGAPNSHVSDGILSSDGPQDNGVTSSGSNSSNAPPIHHHPVTSIVTTGPDGAPMDEASQQSTLSNASAASGDDQCITPKRKNDSYHPNHLAPPSSSPGPHGNLQDDFEMSSPPWSRPPASPVFNSHGPPAEPPTPRSTKKSDSLCKLYDMDENPDRRGWLDKLLSFMEERRSPITACPTISKQPLDLYRLYLLVKERGGFVEVTKSKTWKDIAGLLGIGASSSAAYTLRKHYTKNLLAFECHYDRGGIDPLPIIQQVEAGSKKKTTKTVSVPSPETNFKGSSNSQDSFPTAGSTPTSMDGYSGYQSGYPPGAGPGYNERPPSHNNAQSPHSGNVAPPTAADNISVSNPFDDPVVGGGGPPPRPTGPPFQAGSGASSGGAVGSGPSGSPYPPIPANASRPPQGSPYPAQQGYGGGYPGSDQYGPPQAPGQYPPSQGPFPAQNRMYPPYGGPESDGAPPVSGVPSTTGSDPYRGYGTGATAYGQPPRPYSQPSQTTPSQQSQQSPVATGPPGQASSTPPTAGTPAASPSGTTGTVGQSASPGAPPLAPGAVPGSYTPPAQQFDYRSDQSSPQPRRHPDFTKEPQPYPPYGQRPPGYGGWPTNAGGGPPSGPGPYNRGPYQPQPNVQTWNNGIQRTSGPPGAGGQPTGPGQWDQHRYPQQGQQPYATNPQNQPQQWPIGQPPGVPVGPPSSPGGPTTAMRPQHRGGKPFSMQPPQQGPGIVGPGGPIAQTAQQQQPQTNNMQQATPSKLPPNQFAPSAGGPPAKRDIIFPPDSVEATTPVLYRRKRICRAELGTTDPWRIFMCLQSGLLSESTWALDLLNILLFDDTSVQYFGLAHLPRLLNLLLEHFQKSLSDMFDPDGDDKHGYGWSTCLTVAIKDGDAKCDMDSEPQCNKKPDHWCESKINNNNERSNVKCQNSYDKPPVDLGQVTEQPLSTDRVLVLGAANSPNYTFTTRKGVPVKIKDASDDIFVLDTKRPWDRESDERYHLHSCVGSDAWTYGHIQPRPHDYIIDSFRAEIVHIPFARYLKGSRSKTTSDVPKPHGNPNENLDVKCEESKKDDRVEAPVTKDEKMDEETTEASKKSSVELIDSDCREVDMELERIPNGPQTQVLVESTETSQSDKLDPDTGDVVCSKFDFRSTVIDPAGTLKRKRIIDYEDECYARDEASLYLINESQDTLARRCICISNILRNMTFVPGNETIFANSDTFLAILGKILLLHHSHPVRTQKQRNYDREDDTDFADSCSSLQGETEWWWDYLVQIRENMLVSIANIAGHMQLSKYDELISRPTLDGLLHWAVCPSAHGQDPFPSCSANASLSPQRLALEALCKLCVTDANVDLVIATPPHSRLEKLCSVLTRHLCRDEAQVLREFSVNLLHYLAAADSAMARTVAMQSPCISYLVAFIEQAEQTALGVANQHGINYLRDNPDSMGTSLDMLRRAAGTLLHLARHPDNRTLFLQQEQRLLGLVMSHILDQQVALIISRVLFQVSRGAATADAGKSIKSFGTASMPTTHPSLVVSSAAVDAAAAIAVTAASATLITNAVQENPRSASSSPTTMSSGAAASMVTTSPAPASEMDSNSSCTNTTTTIGAPIAVAATS